MGVFEGPPQAHHGHVPSCTYTQVAALSQEVKVAATEREAAAAHLNRAAALHEQVRSTAFEHSCTGHSVG